MPKSQTPNPAVPSEFIESKIFVIRSRKVMLDRDLAALYGVQTQVLNQAVKRNLGRFPADFMFQLAGSEFQNLISQTVISSWGGTRKAPRAFTEHGILMLSSVLNSEKAVQVNIQIMRMFMKLREVLLTHKQLRDKVEDMEKKYDKQFQVVFEAIKKLLEPPPAPPKRPIGFHASSRT